MLGAVAMLTGKVKGVERIRTFGQVMLGYELAMVVLNYVGGMLPFYRPHHGLCRDFHSLHPHVFYVHHTDCGGGGRHGRGRRGKDDTGHLPQPKPCASGRADALSLRRNTGNGERIGGWGILLFGGYVVFYLACIVYLSFLKEEVQKQEKKRTEITETA